MTLFQKLTRVGIGKMKITKKLINRLHREAGEKPARRSTKPPRPSREGFVQPRCVVFMAAILLSIFVSVGGEPVMAEAAPTSGYSAATLYNAATARAREGKVGAAILNYERARLLAPSDPDIAANLQLVREHAGLSESTQNGVMQILTSVRAGTFGWLGCWGLVAAGLGILFGPRLPKHRLASPVNERSGGVPGAAGDWPGHCAVPANEPGSCSCAGTRRARFACRRC
jgi:hypothetical protein